MELPPVVARELRVRARSPKTWWIRFCVVLAAIFAWVIPMALALPGLDRGKGSLLAISCFPMLVAALCGVVTTADCISRERREKTLGLVLLAPVHPLHLIAQKIIAGTAPVFSGLFAGLPLYVVPVVIGGVTGLEALSVMVLTLATAFISATAGCLVSVFCRSIMSAMTLTSTAVLLLFGSFIAVSGPSGAAEFVRLLNPLTLYLRIFSAPWTNTQLTELGLYVGNAFVLGIVFLLLAATGLPSALRNEHAPEVRRPGRWWLLAAAPPILLMLLDARFPVLFVAALFCSMLAKLLVLISAARVLNSRPWLELILTTPLDPMAYVRYEIRRSGLRLTAVLSACLGLDVWALTRLSSPFLEIGLALILFVIIDSLALLIVGLWNGAKYRNVNQAISFS